MQKMKGSRMWRFGTFGRKQRDTRPYREFNLRYPQVGTFELPSQNDHPQQKHMGSGRRSLFDGRPDRGSGPLSAAQAADGRGTGARASQIAGAIGPPD